MFRKTVAAVFLFLVSASQAFAYSDKTTHPALTGEILDFVGGFSAEERAWTIQGSIDEDFAPRWINHFYDPINNAGWTGAKAGNIPAETLRAMTLVGATDPTSAVNWIKGCNTQSAYWANGGNQTWDKALNYAVEGKTKEAYTALGHILHIVEDLSVPDHTRDDTHAQNLGGDEGSPYEQYTAKYTPETIKSLKIGETLRASGASPAQFYSPEEYLVAMATYSNRYFFSKDTINDPHYPNPKITSENNSFAYGKDEDGVEFPLAAISSMAESSNKYFLKNTSSYSSILDSYFLRLSKQAVLNGAGLVSLFKRELADTPTNNEFNIDSRHTLAKIACQTGDIAGKFNAMGIVSYIGQTVGQGANYAAGQIADTANSIWNFFAGLFRSSTTQIATTDESPAPEDLSHEPSQLANLNSPRTRLAPDSPTPAPPLPPPPKPTAPTTTTTLPTAPKPSNPPKATSTSAATIKLAVDEPPLPPPPKPTTPFFVFIGGGGSVNNPVQSQATSSEATTTPTSDSSHVLISEVLFDADGSDTGKEFIELYNPTDSAKDLTGYSLKYTAENSTTTHTLTLIRTTTSEISIIPPRGFLLFGFGGYDPQNYAGKVADVIRSASLPNGEDTHSAPQKIKLGFINETKIEIDSLSYDKNSITAQGNSLERLASNSACVSPAGPGEFFGNGCTTGENQFEERKNPNPQNSKSFPEPREKPTAPTTPDGGTSIASYSSSTLKINFAWNDSKDFSGSSTGMVYKLFDLGSSTPALLATTTATSTTINISEVGKTYNYGLVAEDQEGLPSATTTLDVEVPDFADNIYFYKNPASPTSSPQYILDIRYSSRPFIPQIYANGMSWQAIVVYLNRTPNPANSTLRYGNRYAPSELDGVISTGEHVSTLLGLASNSCQSVGDGIRRWCGILPEEDNRLALSLSMTSTTATDYATIAYYDVVNSGGYAGDPDFRLVATGAKKIKFEETPSDQNPPTKPESISAGFDENTMKLGVSWSTSTDVDSPDSGITYEFNYSTSTEFAESNWISKEKDLSTVINVIAGNSYLVGVRATDDIGNNSEINSLTWNFPPNFKETIKSSEIPGGGSQYFVAPRDGDISNITVYISSIYNSESYNPSTDKCSLSLSEVLPDGETLLETNNVAPYEHEGAPSCQGGPTFNFSTPPHLISGNKYKWSFGMAGRFVRVAFYGRNMDYVGGLFSDSSIVNAKFILRDTSDNKIIEN